MPNRPNLHAEAEQLRARLAAEPLTDAEAMRLLTRVHGQLEASPRSTWALWGSVGVGLAAASVAAFWLFGPTVDTDWYRLQSGAACVAANAQVVVVAPTCSTDVEMLLPTARVTLAAGSTLQQTPDGLELSQGRARFQVKPVEPQQPPFRVQVNAGTIEVVGTLFDLHTDGERGSLAVTQGTVAFIWRHNGARSLIKAGEQLSWPPAVPPAAAIEPAAPAPSKPAATPTPSHDKPAKHPLLAPPVAPTALNQVAPPPTLAELMRRLAQLKSQRRHAEAVALLQSALQDSALSDLQQERLSYELGLLLLDSSDDRVAACAHWRAHVAKFPAGPRAEAVAAQLRECLP